MSVSYGSDDPSAVGSDVVMDDDESSDGMECRTKVWVSQLPSEGSSAHSVGGDGLNQDAPSTTHLKPSDQPSCQGDPLPSSGVVGLHPLNPQTPVSELCTMLSDQGDRSRMTSADVVELSDHVPMRRDAAVVVPRQVLHLRCDRFCT